MSWGVSPWVYPVWDPLSFLDMGGYFLPILGQFSTITFSSIFPWLFFLSSSQIPVIQMLGHLTLSQRCLRLSSSLLILYFFFFPLCFIYFHHSIFHLTYPIFSLSYSTVVSLQSALDLLLYYSLIDSFLFLLGPC